MSNQKKNKFQPMPASFGLIPELSQRVKDKKLRYKAYQVRSLKVLKEFRIKHVHNFEKNHVPVFIS